jgi:hypothetical protein
VRNGCVLFCACYLFPAGCLLLHQVAHAEGCLFSLLQLLVLEYLLHHQLLDGQHLPFLTAQGPIQISACHLHCQDDHSQLVCHHHSYPREYIHRLFIIRKKHTIGLMGDAGLLKCSYQENYHRGTCHLTFHFDVFKLTGAFHHIQ